MSTALFSSPSPVSLSHLHQCRRSSRHLLSSLRRPRELCRPPFFKPQTQAAAGSLPSSTTAAAAAKDPLAGAKRRLTALFTPFSDPQANAQLLALCAAQGMCSVATLMSDLYLPAFMVDEIGLSNTQIGNLQALSQFLAKATSCVSGTLADLASPAALVIAGTALSAAAKPMLAASSAVHAALGAAACLAWITAAKVFDRGSKGVREAPSKALLAQLAAQSGDSPAAAFSLRYATATAGGLLGALAASLAFSLSGRNYSLTFALASLPALAAVMLVATAFVSRQRTGADEAGSGASSKTHAPEEGEGCGSTNATNSNLAAGRSTSLLSKGRALLGVLPAAYYQSLAVVAILYLARFDITFGTLRARQVMDRASLPALIPCMMLPQALLAPPAGLAAKSSAGARNAVLMAGMAVLVAANLAFAFVPTVPGIVAGALGIGVHMALTHGVSVGMLASYIPATAVPGLGRISGTAWSLTDLLLGVVLAYSNSLAGRLSDLTAAHGMGSVGCFLGGAAACGLSMAALLLFSTFGDLGRDDLLPSKPATA